MGMVLSKRITTPGPYQGFTTFDKGFEMRHCMSLHLKRFINCFTLKLILMVKSPFKGKSVAEFLYLPPPEKYRFHFVERQVFDIYLAYLCYSAPLGSQFLH